ncbi:hypothetical protein ACWDFH_12445 [Streptomyces kronopolitis]
MSNELNLPISQAAELLRGLMEVLYLSTSCASGNHQECRQVDEYRSLVCCCTECEHTEFDTNSPTGAAVPLLHLAVNDDERRDSHVYADGEQLGIRQDLFRSLLKVLDGRAGLPETQRLDLAVQLGVAAVLVFAPRSL